MQMNFVFSLNNDLLTTLIHCTIVRRKTLRNAVTFTASAADAVRLSAKQLVFPHFGNLDPEFKSPQRKLQRACNATTGIQSGMDGTAK